MMTIINRFFPTESKDFKRPSLERQYTKFYEIAAPMPPDGHLSDQQTNALLGEALTRYIDDFIDAILWPRINTHQKEELRRTFEGFCQASLLLLKKYVPIYPNEIIELWLTELDLELDPSQENFDSKIVKLFKRKSLNMRYVEMIMEGRTPDSNFTSEQEELLSYATLCIRDFSRDFEPDNYQKETDFNLRNFLMVHHINPAVLISYIRTIEGRLHHQRDYEMYSRKQIRRDLKACKKIIRELEKYSDARG